MLERFGGLAFLLQDGLTLRVRRFLGAGSTFLGWRAPIEEPLIPFEVGLWIEAGSELCCFDASSAIPMLVVLETGADPTAGTIRRAGMPLCHFSGGAVAETGEALERATDGSMTLIDFAGRAFGFGPVGANCRLEATTCALPGGTLLRMSWNQPACTFRVESLGYDLAPQSGWEGGPVYRALYSYSAGSGPHAISSLSLSRKSPSGVSATLVSATLASASSSAFALSVAGYGSDPSAPSSVSFSHDGNYGSGIDAVSDGFSGESVQPFSGGGVVFTSPPALAPRSYVRSYREPDDSAGCALCVDGVQEMVSLAASLDSAGRAVTVISRDGAAEGLAYDASGRVVSSLGPIPCSPCLAQARSLVPEGFLELPSPRLHLAGGAQVVDQWDLYEDLGGPSPVGCLSACGGNALHMPPGSSLSRDVSARFHAGSPLALCFLAGVGGQPTPGAEAIRAEVELHFRGGGHRTVSAAWLGSDFPRDSYRLLFIDVSPREGFDSCTIRIASSAAGVGVKAVQLLREAVARVRYAPDGKVIEAASGARFSRVERQGDGLEAYSWGELASRLSLFDADKRLVGACDWLGGEDSITYAAASFGGPRPVRLTRLEDGAESYRCELSYDAAFGALLTSVCVADGSPSVLTGFLRDSKGRLIADVRPGGARLFSYDALGRPTAFGFAQPGGQSAALNAVSYGAGFASYSGPSGDQFSLSASSNAAGMLLSEECQGWGRRDYSYAFPDYGASGLVVSAPGAGSVESSFSGGAPESQFPLTRTLRDPSGLAVSSWVSIVSGAATVSSCGDFSMLEERSPVLCRSSFAYACREVEWLSGVTEEDPSYGGSASSLKLPGGAWLFCVEAPEKGVRTASMGALAGRLKLAGAQIAPGFDPAEGACAWHEGLPCGIATLPLTAPGPSATFGAVFRPGEQPAALLLIGEASYEVRVGDGSASLWAPNASVPMASLPAGPGWCPVCVRVSPGGSLFAAGERVVPVSLPFGSAMAFSATPGRMACCPFAAPAAWGEGEILSFLREAAAASSDSSAPGPRGAPASSLSSSVSCMAPSSLSGVSLIPLGGTPATNGSLSCSTSVGGLGCADSGSLCAGPALSQNFRFVGGLYGFAAFCHGQRLEYALRTGTFFLSSTVEVPFEMGPGTSRYVFSVESWGSEAAACFIRGRRVYLRFNSQEVDTGLDAPVGAAFTLGFRCATSAAAPGSYAQQPSLTYGLSVGAQSCFGSLPSGLTAMGSSKICLGRDASASEGEGAGSPLMGLLSGVLIGKSDISLATLASIREMAREVRCCETRDKAGRLTVSCAYGPGGAEAVCLRLSYNAPRPGRLGLEDADMYVGGSLFRHDHVGDAGDGAPGSYGGSPLVRDHRGYVTSALGESFTYSDSGDILTMSSAAGTVTNTYASDAEGRRLLASSSAPGRWQRAFSYPQGSPFPSAVASSGGGFPSQVSFEYFGGGLVRAAVVDGARYVYDYGPDGFRCRKSSPGRERLYAYGPGGRLAYECSPGEWGVHYSYSPSGRPLSLEYSEPGGVSARYLFVVDQFGCIVGLATLAGDLAATLSCTAYGAILPGSEQDCTPEGVLSKASLRFKGYPYEPELRMYLLGGRLYDPWVGRFLSPDGYGYLTPDTPSGLNLFAYCGNDPVLLSDLTGHCSALTCAMIGLGILALTGFGLMIGGWVSGNDALMNIGDCIISGAEIAAGIALIATGVGGAWGTTVLGAGIGSLTNGLITMFHGGSYHAGWIGGELAGLISRIPYVGGTIGAFVGSACTDWIDGQYDWASVDLMKAGSCAAITFGLSWLSNTVEWGARAGFYTLGSAANYVLSYNSALLSISNSIINTYWRGREKPA